MNRLFLLPICFFALACTSGSTDEKVEAVEAQAQDNADQETHFGAALSDAAPVSLDALYTDAKAQVGKSVVLQGEVKDVCQKKGCWAVIANGPRTIRVIVPDHNWALPKDLAGKQVKVEGTVVEADTGEKTVKHFEGESKNEDAMPEKQELELVLGLELKGAEIIKS